MELHAVKRVLAVGDGFHPPGSVLGQDQEIRFQGWIAHDDLLVALAHFENGREAGEQPGRFFDKDFLVAQVLLPVLFHQAAEGARPGPGGRSRCRATADGMLFRNSRSPGSTSLAPTILCEPETIERGKFAGFGKRLAVIHFMNGQVQAGGGGPGS